MNNVFIDTAFLLFSIALFCKIIAYGVYEIKHEKNVFGGICATVFSFASIVFSNVMVWIS